MLRIRSVLSGVLVAFSRGLIGGAGTILATLLRLYVVGPTPPCVEIGMGALAVSASAYINLFSHAMSGNAMTDSFCTSFSSV
jgi:uncharacterized membrane protein YfcA